MLYWDSISIFLYSLLSPSKFRISGCVYDVDVADQGPRRVPY